MASTPIRVGLHRSANGYRPATLARPLPLGPLFFHNTSVSYFVPRSKEGLAPVGAANRRLPSGAERHPVYDPK